MRELKIPELGGDAGGWIDVKFLPEDLREELQLLMVDARLPKADTNAFLNHCERVARIVSESRAQIGHDIEKSQLGKIALKAHSLLAAINVTNEQTRETLIDVAIDLRLRKPGAFSGALLSLTWDYVQALEQAANYAAEQIELSRQAKPKIINGRDLTLLVVDAYWRRFNALPPADRAGWFAGFMQRLGEHLDMQCGPRIVGNAIKAKKINAH